MNTKRTFRVKLAGDRPRLGTITSRLWLATVDVMRLPAAQAELPITAPAPVPGQTPYRVARRMVVGL
jgi:hypothetical protein